MDRAYPSTNKLIVPFEVSKPRSAYKSLTRLRFRCRPQVLRPDCSILTHREVRWQRGLADDQNGQG